LRTLLSGRVRLGLPDGAITDPGSPIVAGLTKFAARTSEVELLVSCNQPTEVAKALAADELDVAIATFPRPIPHLVHRPLYIEESGVFCGDRHPLFQRSDERLLEEARHYPFATHAHWFGEDLRAMGIGKAHATVHQIEAVATLILAGGHIGFLPIHYAQRWVDGGAMKRIGATEVTSACRFDVVTRRGMDTTPAVSAIIEDLFWRKGPALEPENYQIPAG